MRNYFRPKKRTKQGLGVAEKPIIVKVAKAKGIPGIQFNILLTPNVQNVVPIDQYKTFQSHKEDFPKLKQISTINFGSANPARTGCFALAV